jgi:outer membrane receptor protein involved in Fe transport
LFFGNGPLKFTEYAGFTDLTVHFTDRFDVQLGGRESHIEQAAEQVFFEGPLVGGGTVLLPPVNDTANAFTYLLTPRWKISSDLMAYARIASGYRPAVTNNFNPDPLVPRASKPDKTQNYEIGVKGDALNHVLTFDASLYYINWKNIQIELVDPADNISYTTNGSSAKSEGAELSVELRPLAGLTIAGWASYDDAVLTESMPPGSAVYGPSGSRLPYGSRFSGNLSLNQTFPLVGDITGFGGAQLSYVGDRLGTFVPLSPNAPRADYPAYTKVDLRAGVTSKAWSVNLYANNVANRRGLLGGGAGTIPPFSYYYIQPRTVGLSLVKTF